MAGRRKGRTTVPAKRAAFFTGRAAGQPPAQQLAEYCDWVKAAADGKPDNHVRAIADQMRKLAEGIDI
jgi:hypothetical protein